MTNIEIFNCLLDQLNKVCHTQLTINSVQLNPLDPGELYSEVSKASANFAVSLDYFFSDKGAHSIALKACRKASVEHAVQYMFYMLRYRSLICVPLHSNVFRVIPYEQFNALIQRCPGQFQRKLLYLFDPAVMSSLELRATEKDRLQTIFETHPDDVLIDIACAVAYMENSVVPLLEALQWRPEIPVNGFVEYEEGYLKFAYKELYAAVNDRAYVLAVKKLLSYDDALFDKEFCDLFSNRYVGADTLYTSVMNNIRNNAEQLPDVGSVCTEDVPEGVCKLADILRRDGDFDRILQRICSTCNPRISYKDFARQCLLCPNITHPLDLYVILNKQIEHVYGCKFNYIPNVPAAVLSRRIGDLLKLDGSEVLESLKTDSAATTIYKLAQQADPQLMADIESFMLQHYGRYFVLFSKECGSVETISSANAKCSHIRLILGLSGVALRNAFILADIDVNRQLQPCPSDVLKQLVTLAKRSPEEAIEYARQCIYRYNSLDPLCCIEHLLYGDYDITFKAHSDMRVAPPQEDLLRELTLWSTLAPEDAMKRLERLCSIAPMAIASNEGIFAALCTSASTMKNK